jgi:hypothetical protein
MGGASSFVNDLKMTPVISEEDIALESETIPYEIVKNVNSNYTHEYFTSVEPPFGRPKNKKSNDASNRFN